MGQGVVRGLRRLRLVTKKATDVATANSLTVHGRPPSCGCDTHHVASREDAGCRAIAGRTINSHSKMSFLLKIVFSLCFYFYYSKSQKAIQYFSETADYSIGGGIGLLGDIIIA